MKVKDIVSVLFDDIIIYKKTQSEENPYEDLYKGNKEEIPLDILSLTVCSIGAKKKGTIDIRVK